MRFYSADVKQHPSNKGLQCKLCFGTYLGSIVSTSSRTSSKARYPMVDVARSLALSIRSRDISSENLSLPSLTGAFREQIVESIECR